MLRAAASRSGVIEVDGSYGEGGGQILRSALALAALRRLPLHIWNIRAGRDSPGLQAQHLTGVRAVAALCAAEVQGLELGSQELVFRPGPIKEGAYEFEVGTAGSVFLVLQACLPVAFGASGEVRLRVSGGTDVRAAPPADYMTEVFLPLIRRLGGDVTLSVIRRGYYPRGGGVVEAVIQPSRLWQGLSLPASALPEEIQGVAHVGNLSEDIARRMAVSARAALAPLGRDIDIRTTSLGGERAFGQGGAIVLWAAGGAAILAADGLAERGKPAERVGRRAAEQLLHEIASGATLDQWTADQLLVYLAQADDPSTFLVKQPTGHLTTMAWLVTQILDRPVRVEQANDLWKVEL